MVSPAGTALPPAGASGWGGLIGREGARREGASAAPQATLSLVKYRAGAAHCFPAGGWGASPAPSECPSGDATACPPAPSWMRPSAVSGRLGKASPAPGPPRPGGARGAVAPRWPKAEGSRAAVSPRPERGQEFCLSYQISLECLPGTEAAGRPLGLGGCPGPGGGLPGRCCHGPALGVSGDSFRGLGRSWGCGAFPREPVPSRAQWTELAKVG